MAPDVLLWDLGDTLVDERWMRPAPVGFPTWPAAWAGVMRAEAADWNSGAVRAPQIYAALAERTGMTVPAVEAHARRCCRSLLFNPTAWRVARERRLPQALVTVNPDMVADHVIPAYDMEAVFDSVVVSAVEGTIDKPALCDIALGRLGHRGNRSRALLIDNRLDLADAWREQGGSAYWFREDRPFSRDVVGLLDAPRVR